MGDREIERQGERGEKEWTPNVAQVNARFRLDKAGNSILEEFIL